MKNALIVDDEPLARRRLRRLLEATSEVRVVGACRNAEEALATLGERSEELDVVFLDLRMPGVGGFELIDLFGRGRMPPVVFVTAHDEYAVRAFEMEAVDYVLKPVDETQLRRALSRLAPTAAGGLERLCRALAHRIERERRRSSECRACFLVKDAGRTLFVPVDAVDVIRAEGNYARLVSSGRTYLVRETMTRLTARLDPERFVRVGRSVIVRLDAVSELGPSPSGRIAVRMKSGAEVSVSRRHRRELARRLGL